MENFIKLQNILIDPKKSFDDFKNQLIHSQITQSTYLCLLLNISATIKRPNFHFQFYLDLLTNFKNQPSFRVSCINYTGYKDKISILMNACQKSVSSTVQILVNHPDIKLHSVDPHGLNAVFYAIKNSDQIQGLKILQILRQKSPQILDIVTQNGLTPLFFAVQKFRIKIVDFLLSNQTDPNQKLINNGNTPMHELGKISSKYSLQEVKKMIQLFMKYGFDWTIKNNYQKTVEEYTLDMRFNITQIMNQIKFNKKYYKSSSQFGFYSQQSETDAYSSKIATNKIQDYFTSRNQSQIQSSQYNYIQVFSISSKSLLSEVYDIKRIQDRQKQFSVDVNIDFSIKDNEPEDFQFEEMQRRMECHSHSDSPKSQFSVSQNNVQIKQCANQSIAHNESSQQSFCSQSENCDYLRVEQIDYQKIERDILQFDQISQGTYISAWNQIQSFFLKLNQITQPLGLVIQLIGSFATGLWTHLSDIDIALVALNQSYIDFQKLLQKVYNKLKGKMFQMGIKQLSYNKVSKIPSIKIQMDPYLFASRKIDLMIFHKKNIGITYVNYIREALINFAQIRPLYFFLKRICEQFRLHDPFNGGMKSYSIFLMIYSLLKSIETKNLGQSALKIALYYGFYHQYDYQINFHPQNQIQIVSKPILKLNIKDPLNMKNNMGGKNTDTYKVKNMFRTIYYALHKKITKGTHLQHILELASIISQ